MLIRSISSAWKTEEKRENICMIKIFVTVYLPTQCLPSKGKKYISLSEASKTLRYNKETVHLN